MARDRIPNYTLAEDEKALATLTTELVPEASPRRERLARGLDWISQAVFLTEELVWHFTGKLVLVCAKQALDWVLNICTGGLQGHSLRHQHCCGQDHSHL